MHRDRAPEFSFDKIIGRSPAMQEMLRLARRAAESEVSPVLLQGEPGTGKATTARAIHYASKRADRPFIDINCRAIPRNLIEMELFGYENGASTDGKVGKEGLLEQVDGGTVFLDEISELDIKVQVKLLHAMESGSFRRIGGQKNLNFSAHVIAASDRDLWCESEEGRFRWDLYERLALIKIDVPPLRERGDDVLILAQHFLTAFGISAEDIGILTPEIAHALRSHDWLGNVSELRNVLERAVILVDRDKSLTEYLLLGIVPGEEVRPLRFGCPSGVEEDATANLTHVDILMDEIETFLKEAHAQSGSNKTHAVEPLGMAHDQDRFRLEKLRKLIEADACHGYIQRAGDPPRPGLSIISLAHTISERFYN